MARDKENRSQGQMIEGKRNIIHQLLEECDIKTADDIQNALKDLLGENIKEILQIEDLQNRPLDEVYPVLYIDAIQLAQEEHKPYARTAKK